MKIKQQILSISSLLLLGANNPTLAASIESLPISRISMQQNQQKHSDRITSAHQLRAYASPSKFAPSTISELHTESRKLRQEHATECCICFNE